MVASTMHLIENSLFIANGVAPSLDNSVKPSPTVFFPNYKVVTPATSESPREQQAALLDAKTLAVPDYQVPEPIRFTT